MRVKPVFLYLSSPAALTTASQVKYTDYWGQDIQQAACLLNPLSVTVPARHT